MRRFFRLPALAITAWAAFGGLWALIAAMLAARVWHPHFLPVTALLAVLLSSTLALLVGGAWRLVRGPGRLRAATWVLLGMAPALFQSGHLLYGLKAGSGRQVELNLALKSLIPLGESVFDLLCRVQYPVRTEGQTVVMISTPVADARKQVAAMDRHVQALRGRLGGGGTGRIHWVRGPLLGIGGHAIYGMCMGSEPGTHPVDDEGLSSLDRHEVAHCVLSDFVPTINANPPAVLVEGWAEANMGHDTHAAAIRAWEYRDQQGALTLRELVGPGWYSRHHWPAYVQGAALVNHILRVWGPAKFLELFATCRPGTFPQDCRRVLGIDLDRLDADYWSEIDQMVGDAGAAIARLRRMGVRLPVTPAAWGEFLDEYLVRSRALARPYENVRMTFERHYEYTNQQGQPAAETHRVSVLRAGDRAALTVAYPKVAVAHLATPGHSFVARKPAETGTWEIVANTRETPATAYRRALRPINNIDQVSHEAALLLVFSDELANRADPTHILVTRLDRFEEHGHPMVRVQLVDPWVVPTDWRSVTILMAADDSLAARACDVERADGSRLHVQIDYEDRRADAGPPIVSGIRFTDAHGDGKSHAGETTIVERTFGPVPASEFTESALLDGPVVRKPGPAADEPYRDPPTFADWYPAPLIAGVAAIACGVATGLLGGFRRDVVGVPASAGLD